MKLTDPVIKAAKPKEKPYLLPDDGHWTCIYWCNLPSGAKWWRYRYRFKAVSGCYCCDLFLAVPSQSMN